VAHGKRMTTSRRRFMSRTSTAIDELVGRLALEPAEQRDVRARMARYNRECGCALGGASMVVALLAAVAYLIATETFGVGVAFAAVAFVFACSLLGKAVGLLVASLRLELLRRSLCRRLRAEGERHVYVY
jgi:hypothetical protein